MYSSKYTSGFSGPAASHLAAPPSPRHEGNVGQAPRSRNGEVARDKREDGLVSLVYLVCLVCLVEPDRPERPDEPDQPSPVSPVSLGQQGSVDRREAVAQSGFPARRSRWAAANTS